jgi:hypothetical protein
MAICFDCWKLVKITDVEPKKEYFNRWRRYGYEIRPADLMKYHWDNECFKTNKHIKAVLKGPACLFASSKPEISREKLPVPITSGNSEIFISSPYAK